MLGGIAKILIGLGALALALILAPPILAEVTLPFVCRQPDSSCLVRYRALGHVWSSYGLTSRAQRWYEEGAEAGDPIAMFHLAWTYQNESEDRAMETLHELAREGTGKAWAERWQERVTENLLSAPRHKRGEGIDLPTVLEAFDRAAHAVNPELTLALKWYGRAAQKGFTPAVNNLAVLYYNGIAGMKDSDAAGALLYGAAETSNPVATANFEYIDEKSDASERQAWRRTVNYPAKSDAADLLNPTLDRTLYLKGAAPGKKRLVPENPPVQGLQPLTPDPSIPTFDDVRKRLRERQEP